MKRLNEELLATELTSLAANRRRQLNSFVSHPYEHYVVDLFLYECTLADPESALESRAVNAFKWVASNEFDQYPFTPADEASMNKLLGVS